MSSFLCQFFGRNEVKGVVLWKRTSRALVLLKFRRADTAENVCHGVGSQSSKSVGASQQESSERNGVGLGWSTEGVM